MKLPILCDSCKHLRADGATCVAFPAEIPEGIRTWGDPHIEPVFGQTGDTVWELKEGKENQKRAWDLLRTAL